MHDDHNLYEPSRREWLATLGGTGLTLAVLLLAGYLTPHLLAAALR